ncbi:hypothetical protein [Anaerococcus marasmi]|uniref:hypothetical protein n=1 Tax=Anaerococcus marasmi TaxID=2057797 RepID=UPI000CFA6841|nr:hypothetical protein [Anaerococcus marasmi]
MIDTSELFIYKENSIEKIRGSLPIYKKLGINILSIDMDEFINDDYLREIFFLNEFLNKRGFSLMLRIDLLILSKNLLDSKVDDLTWKNTKVKRAGLSFLNFLVKRGISAFDFLNLSAMVDDRNFLEDIREINKNVRHLNKNVLTTGLIDKPEIIKYLSSKAKTDFSFIQARIDYLKIEDLNSFYKSGPIFAKTWDNFSNKFSKNFAYFSISQKISNILALKGAVYLESDDIDFEMEGPLYKLTSYIENLSRIREENKSLTRGDFLEIFKKDKDIFAYIRRYENEKSLVINNLSQKEFLLPISMYLADYSSYKLALGNYGQRSLVANLLVRPFETLIFIKK